MGKIHVPFFVALPGKGGSTRHYWQPSAALRRAGWPAERLADDLTAALARARAINDQVAAWRQGSIAAPGDIAGGTIAPLPRQIGAGSMADLIRRYRASRFWLELSPRSKRSYHQNIQVIEDWAGDLPAARITAAAVQDLYETMRRRTPAKAAAVITMLRILLQHGVREGMMTINAAVKPGIRVARQEEPRLWTQDAADLFVEAADRMGWHSVGTALVINLWIGQREGDILDMPREAWRDGAFFIRQSKTGRRVRVPQSPRVAARVTTELQRQAQRGVSSATHLLLCETTGQPWTGDWFRHVFADIRTAVAAEWPAFALDAETIIPTDRLWFMHCRHTAVTALANAGCTALQIAGITGHSAKTVTQLLDRYLVMTSALAGEAVALRLAAEGDQGWA